MDHKPNSPGIRRWCDSVDWIIDSLTDKPVGFIFELGPGDLDDFDDEDRDICCIQAQILEDDVVMLRRSRDLLRRLRLGSFSTAGVPIDRWLFNGHFEDCTDGYIFSRDRELLAGAIVAWFRDSCGIASPDAVGMSYRFPDTLMPDDEEEEIDDSEFI